MKTRIVLSAIAALLLFPACFDTNEADDTPPTDNGIGTSPSDPVESEQLEIEEAPVSDGGVDNGIGTSPSVTAR
jgi:hypothetical protein